MEQSLINRGANILIIASTGARVASKNNASALKHCYDLVVSLVREEHHVLVDTEVSSVSLAGLEEGSVAELEIGNIYGPVGMVLTYWVCNKAESTTVSRN